MENFLLKCTSASTRKKYFWPLIFLASLERNLYCGIFTIFIELWCNFKNLWRNLSVKPNTVSWSELLKSIVEVLLLELKHWGKKQDTLLFSLAHNSTQITSELSLQGTEVSCLALLSTVNCQLPQPGICATSYRKC